MTVDELQKIARLKLADLIVHSDGSRSLEAIELALRVKSDAALSNAGEAWRPGEERLLLRDFDRRISLAEIADRLGRTVGGVKARLKLLGKEV